MSATSINATKPLLQYQIDPIGDGIGYYQNLITETALNWSELQELQQHNRQRIGWFKASLQTVRTHTYTSMAKDLLFPTTINHVIPRMGDFFWTPIFGPTSAGLGGGFTAIFWGTVMVVRLLMAKASYEFNKEFLPKSTPDRIASATAVVLGTPILISLVWDVATLIVRLARLHWRIKENAERAERDPHPVINSLCQNSLSGHLKLRNFSDIGSFFLVSWKPIPNHTRDLKFDLIELPDTITFADDAQAPLAKLLLEREKMYPFEN